jgi:hypothetical protein
MKRKVLEKGIYFHKGPVGNLERGSFSREFERWMEAALEVESLPLMELCVGNV